jgi:hypothetical protein
MAISGEAGTAALVPQGAVQQSPAEGCWVLGRLPESVIDSFTSEQKEAIRQAVSSRWGRHGVNIRVSLPWFGRRFYLTIVGGEERRPIGRRIEERSSNPLYTVANSLFLAAVAFAFYAVVLVGLLVKAAVIEF